MRLRALMIGIFAAGSIALAVRGQFGPLAGSAEHALPDGRTASPMFVIPQAGSPPSAAATGVESASSPDSAALAADSPAPPPAATSPAPSQPPPGTPAAPAAKPAPAAPSAASGSSAALAAKPAPVAPAPAPSSSAALAAPCPKPLIKTHFNTGSGKYLFKDRAWDLSQVKRAFNGVIVAYGDPKLIDDVRAAGLVAMVEFDLKDDYIKGKPVTKAVDAIIRQVKAYPGTIAGIRVADRVNQRLSPELAIAYLQATGGVFHREVPGVPIVVDVEDWELTCGLPGQSSCTAHTDDDYKYCTNDVLMRIYKSGYVDGFELAVNLKKDDPAAMMKAITKARSLFPSPFLIFARTASLSFDGDHYPDDAATAKNKVAAYIEAPLKAGADGIDLWAWHRPWKEELRSFLDKGGASNALWEEMTKTYAATMASKKP